MSFHGKHYGFSCKGTTADPCQSLWCDHHQQHFLFVVDFIPVCHENQPNTLQWFFSWPDHRIVSCGLLCKFWNVFWPPACLICWPCGAFVYDWQVSTAGPLEFRCKFYLWCCNEGSLAFVNTSVVGLPPDVVSFGDHQNTNSFLGSTGTFVPRRKMGEVFYHLWALSLHLPTCLPFTVCIGEKGFGGVSCGVR